MFEYLWTSDFKICAVFVFTDSSWTEALCVQQTVFRYRRGTQSSGRKCNCFFLTDISARCSAGSVYMNTWMYSTITEKKWLWQMILSLMQHMWLKFYYVKSKNIWSSSSLGYCTDCLLHMCSGNGIVLSFPDKPISGLFGAVHWESLGCSYWSYCRILHH